MCREAPQYINSMYDMPAERRAAVLVPETAQAEIPEFVVLAVSLGVPFAPAERLWARIVVTLAEMDAGKITDEQAAARIDRLAGLVFMAARGGAQ